MKKFFSPLRKNVIAFLLAAFLKEWASPRVSYAAVPQINVSTVDDLVRKVFCPIAETMFTILMVVSTIMVLWAAYTYLTAGGDAEKIRKATHTLAYAAVAVFVALIARGFPAIVATVFNTTLTSGCP